MVMIKPFTGRKIKRYLRARAIKILLGMCGALMLCVSLLLAALEPVGSGSIASASPAQPARVHIVSDTRTTGTTSPAWFYDGRATGPSSAAREERTAK